MRLSGQLNSIAEANAAARILEEEKPSSRTLVRMATRGANPEPVGENEGPVSVWLYVGGLCVTLSGLYAVNFNMEDSNFAMLSYGLAICGYVTSYLLRVSRTSFQTLRLPLLVVLGLGLIAWLSSDKGMTGLAPHVEMDDRSKWLQIFFLWIAILHTFTLTTDASVLFACVPCMTMIALVSTTSQDSEIQNTFLIFIAAATFLMVHENFLRTRPDSVSGPALSRSRRMFGGQVQLTLFCVVSALLLANLVVVPIRAVGQSLLLANALNPLNNSNNKPNIPNASAFSNDSQVINIATGPVAESDTPVMRIQTSKAANWRGTTYDYYTGHSFENHLGDSHRLASQNDASSIENLKVFRQVQELTPPADQWAHYTVNASPVELPLSDMQGKQTVQQTVTMLNDGTYQFYGAGDPLFVSWPSQAGVLESAEGSVIASEAFAMNSQYRMLSVAPTDDLAKLRAAPSDLQQFPLEIVKRYLQRAALDSPSNGTLRHLAQSITAQAQNNYDRAAAIQNYIARTCKYNLQAQAAPPQSDRVEYFLTVGQQGYCDSFAASMTMLCRYADIPARMAAGYLPGEPEGKGDTYLVRQKHKHVWTEVFFPNIGWVPFDATDGAEDISDHTNRSQQKRLNLLTWMFSHGWLPPLAAASILILLGYLFVTELLPRLRVSKEPLLQNEAMPPTNRAVALAYQQACRLLERRGLPRLPSVTPEEYAAGTSARLHPHQPEAATALLNLTQLHDRFRYGQETAAPQDAQQAHSSLQSLKHTLSKISRRALAT